MVTIKQKDPEVTRKDLAAREERRQREVAMAAKRRELWSAINSFVSKSGGWLTSAPHEPWLRIEIRDGSELPNKLHSLGYALRSAGVGERIEGGTITPIQVFQFRIPLRRP